MKNIPLINKQHLFSSYERAKLVSLFTDASALLYHITILIVFGVLKVYPMMYYNIISISVFTILLILINRVKNFVGIYQIALFEVIIHQILADYFLGTATSFHYFILLMGLLPFLIFQDKFKLSVILTIFTSIVFLFLENSQWPGKYEISVTTIRFLKVLNTTITTFVIIFMILIFTYVVLNTEQNLETKNKILENEIKMASVIQQNFFKQEVDTLNQYKVAFYSKPSAGVSGDIYDFYKTGNKLDGLGIFDVSGHGISSGLVTMLVKNIIHQEFYNHPDLELWEILDHINKRVIEEKGDIENYLTGILLRLNNNGIEITMAGHPSPIIYRKSTGKCEFYNPTQNSIGAIGISDFPVFYTSEFLDFEDGDELILYSDGIYDVCNDSNESFGTENLLKTIEDVIELDPENQIRQVFKTINDFKGTTNQKDDITMIILKK